MLDFSKTEVRYKNWVACLRRWCNSRLFRFQMWRASARLHGIPKYRSARYNKLVHLKGSQCLRCNKKTGAWAGEHLRHRWVDSASVWCRRAEHRWCWQRVGPVCCSWRADRRRVAWHRGCRRWWRGAGSRPPATIRARPSARREHRYVKRWSRAAGPGAARRGLPPCAPARPAPPAPPATRRPEQYHPITLCNQTQSFNRLLLMQTFNFCIYKIVCFIEKGTSSTDTYLFL